MRKLSRWIPIIGGAVAGGIIALVIAGNSHTTRSVTTTVVQQASPRSEPTSFANTSGAGESINQIYKSDAPGVVDIKVIDKQSSGGNSLGNLFGGGGGGGGGSSQPETGGEGAGVVYDSNGDILTDEHVVANAAKVTVTFQDGKTAPAKVLGTDASTDVGVIKVNVPSSELHPIKFADSSSAVVGDPVVAIGSPFGLPETVTSGIVSQTGRPIKAPNGWTISDAIQTDAAINPGNSGGPLLNANGQALGLNDQIETDTSSATGQGQNAGIGFATPGNDDVTVANQIISTGHAEHAYLGVGLKPDTKNGAQIASIQPNSPSASAGIEVNDLVTKLNGTAITSTNQLINTLNDHYKPGQTITLTVQRQGQTKQIKVTLGNRPETQLTQN
jgi:S1-C subfamily serine protease